MANPAVVTVDEIIIGSQEDYTKVATAVQTGFIWRQKADAEYFYTYRLTGEAAPTDLDEAVRIFKDDDDTDNQVGIQASEPIDVYLYALNAEGKVRVDI